MINYKKRDLSAAFKNIDKTVMQAAAKSMSACTLNEKPALLSFDEAETDTVTYDLIRGATTIVITAKDAVTANQKAQQIAQQLVQDFQQNFKENLR